jgi:predicted transcriptional regulator of viral defense system
MQPRWTELEQKALAVIGAYHRPVRTHELLGKGVHPRTLYRLRDAGALRQLQRGLYVPADTADPTEHHDLVKVASRSEKAVVCLLSALSFHGLTTQAPREVWIAIPGRAWRPRSENPPVRVFTFSVPSYGAGVETHDLEGVPVRVYSPAKTVADCFKFRSKVGKDVAIEALRETWRQRRATMDELWRFAQVCRVANVIRPYLESLT